MNKSSSVDFTVTADRDIDGQPCVIFSLGKIQQDGSFQIDERNVMTIADACRLAKDLSAAIFDADVMAVVDENAREVAEADTTPEAQRSGEHVRC